MAFSLPVSLGCATLVFSHVGLELLPAGLFALFLSMVWMHATTAQNPRPIVYGARFFEATTLAAMLDQIITQLPAWGLVNTSGVRLAFFCLIGAVAGASVGLLYLLRADRFMRLIPSPVFVGFSNSIALVLFVSQSRTLLGLFLEAPLVVPIASVFLAVLGIAIALRYWRPRWPTSAIALTCGLAIGLLWSTLGVSTPTLGSFGWESVLPVTLADFGALTRPRVQTWQAMAAILVNGGILGVMMFINTTMTSEVMTQSDGLRNTRRAADLIPAAGLALAGLFGSVPMSGSMNASQIAARKSALSPTVMMFCAVVCAVVYVSGMVGLIPLAAVCGALLCEAWFLVDRGSVRLLLDWLNKRPLRANGGEDLALIAAVTITAALLNMVAAVFVGLLFGLLVFAARNARRPVRQVWNGAQLSSNCARSRHDLALLAQHGAGIRVVELEGDLFFGVVDRLERSLAGALTGATSLVIDWSRVNHVDTSLMNAFLQFERRARGYGVIPIHAGVGTQDSELCALFQAHLPHAVRAVDLDRALEKAENEIILLRSPERDQDGTAMTEVTPLFDGLTDEECSRLQSMMTHQLFHAGEVILQAGEPGDELLLVLQGSASVVLPTADGTDVRLAGVRRGATLGDIAFLDHARRSATVIAEEDTTVAILTRTAYDQLCASHPRLVQCLLSNIALGLAARLRHTNRLALAHQARH